MIIVHPWRVKVYTLYDTADEQAWLEYSFQNDCQAWYWSVWRYEDSSGMRARVTHAWGTATQWEDALMAGLSASQRLMR